MRFAASTLPIALLIRGQMSLFCGRLAWCSPNRSGINFLNKVKKLPCEFWSTADELAFQVSSALSIKFQEETRNGWIPYNPYGVPLEKVEDLFVGCYDLLYYSEIKARSKRIIKSKLVIEATGVATFYNNLKDDNVNAEYIYRGSCHITENIVYIFLNNSVSKERAVFYLIRSVGKLDRLIGLLIALSSNMIPVCIKVACFKEELFNKGINEDLLSDIITSCNTVWENNMLTIEESQKHLFFSDEMLLWFLSLLYKLYKNSWLPIPYSNW